MPLRRVDLHDGSRCYSPAPQPAPPSPTVHGEWRALGWVALLLLALVLLQLYLPTGA